MRPASDALTAYYARLEQKPFAHDFYQTMRRLECLHGDRPRWGMALRPQDEPLRIGQEPSLAFAPSSLSSFTTDSARPPRLEIRFFGLLGPNGPLPLHLTDHARQRILHAGDKTFSRFLDILHHRYAQLFYRAWAQAQPTVSLDRPREDRFASYVGALFGIGQPGLQGRDRVQDNAKRFHAGILARNARNAEGLATVLTDFFSLPVAIQEYVGHWMPIEEGDQSRLGASGLGRNAVLGRRVWDRQGKFRVRIGPLNSRQYADFLPDGSALPRLVDWVRLYTSGELFWDVQLILRHEDIPELRCGQSGRLGWSSWLGGAHMHALGSELILDAERLIAARDKKEAARRISAGH